MAVNDKSIPNLIWAMPPEGRGIIAGKMGTWIEHGENQSERVPYTRANEKFEWVWRAETPRSDGKPEVVWWDVTSLRDFAEDMRGGFDVSQDDRRMFADAVIAYLVPA